MLSQPDLLVGHPIRAVPQAGDELIYVYAIVTAGTLVRLPPLCMDRDRPVYTLENEGLQAVVGRVRAEGFAQAVLQANLQQAAWVETHVRLHQQVLDRLVAMSAAVLPLRFCTIYRNEAAVQRLLADHAGTLRTELQRLADKQEWGVKLFIDANALHDAIGHNPIALPPWTNQAEIAQLQAQIATVSRGAAFLLRKKLETALGQAVDTLSFGLADDSHRCLTDYAVAALLNPLYPQCPEMHLNAAYLVANEHLPAFQRELARLGERYGAVGVQYTLSGPWPAYNFLRLNVTDKRESA